METEKQQALRVLILEDVPTDADLSERELRKAGIAFTSLRVDSREIFVRALEEFGPDVVLSDYKLPDFDGLAALAIVRQTHPEVPVIIVTGVLPDIEAVELLHAGARDYVLKDRLARLGPAVQRALSEERGIRARKAAERTVRESEEKYRQLFESSRDALMTLAPPTWKFTGANQATLDLFGATSPAEFTALGPVDTSPEKQPDGRPSTEKAQEMIDKAIREGSNFFEWEHRRLNGGCFAADVLLTRMQIGADIHLQATVRDITERKQAEAALARLARTYRIISLCNGALVRASDETQLAQEMCIILGESGGFAPVWVALLSETGELRPVAWYGKGENFAALLDEIYASPPEKPCPGCEVLRTREPAVISPLPDDPASRLAKLKALGASAAIALPLLGDSQIFGLLVLCSSEPEPFGEENRALLMELAADLGFGIARLRNDVRRRQLEAERLHNLEALERNLDATVAAIAATVEMRDPYTAGHQRRVARLATAIAIEMGLPVERTEGIRIAGIIHDIGKIHVPAEILSSPAKLTDAEFEIIKTHPGAGYDILKDIEFNWPVAEIVRQHHERLDGSGYPRGLRGDEILQEARILCVADVIEAMSSHRPYRPGFGIFPALQEISRHKGAKYDIDVVNACLRLFLEKGYVFGDSAG